MIIISIRIHIIIIIIMKLYERKKIINKRPRFYESSSQALRREKNKSPGLLNHKEPIS